MNNIKLVYFGNDGNIIKSLYSEPGLHISGIIAESVSALNKKYFGSAYDFAKSKHIPVVEPKIFQKAPISILNKKFGESELGFSQGYGYLIPVDVINYFSKGIVNFHQSYLPAYKGRHSLNWALINGEEEAGITFHYINEKFDDGRIIYQEKIAIDPMETIMDLYDKTIEKGISRIRSVFIKIMNNEVLKPQEGNTSYYPPRKPEDGEINNTFTVKRVVDMVRALVFPYPGAFIRCGKNYIILEEVMEVLQENIPLHNNNTKLFWFKNKLYMKLSINYKQNMNKL